MLTPENALGVKILIQILRINIGTPRAFSGIRLPGNSEYRIDPFRNAHAESGFSFRHFQDGRIAFGYLEKSFSKK